MRENKNDPKKIYCLNLLKSLSVTRQIDFQMKEAINRWLIILFVVFAIILSPMISRSPIISMSKASEKEANSVSLQIKDKAREGQLAKGLPQMKGRESVMVQVESEGSEVIFLNYSLPLPKLALLDEKIEGKTVKRLILGNAPNTGHEGEPELPVIPSKVIIPAHRSIAKIDVIRGEKIALPGEHFIEYAKAIYPLIPNVEIKKIGPKNAIYNSDNGFPRKSHYFVGVQKKYGVSVAIVNLFPITYHPKSGKVYYYKNISLKITTEPDASIIKSGIRNRLEKFDSIKFGVENPETLNSYRKKEEEIPLPAGSFNALDSYQYVLITSETIRDADTDVTVHDLIAQKQSRGLTAAIVTIEEIYDSFSGIDNAEKLRNGIIWFYNNWETDYVLLGGDINIIPMRKLWCQAYAGGEADNIPSDLYFQCLDGSYNSDGDSRWGEPDDGQDIPGGNGDVDLMAELFIGRASAENAEEMSNFVYKTIAYENESPAEPYLRHALMAGEHLGFGGDSEYAKLSMEEIRLGSDAHGYTTAGFAASPLFIVDTLYDADGTWPKSEIIADINSNEYSIFNHLGHANDHYVMKFYNADADALTNTNFLFAYSQGCIPGNFEVDCIGEHLTTTHRHGMFAVVFNSRYGWGRHNSTAGPSQLFDRQFWDAYFGEYILNLGAMNASSHEDNLWDINGDCIRWCYYETNLLGDPHTTIHGLAIGPLLAYDLHTHDDSAGGNSDGIINPGEEIDLTVTLINIGSEDAISVSATLSTEDDYITITDNSAEFGDILCCGARKKALDSYIFNVDPNCPSTHNATFELLITDANSESWSSEFIITVYESSLISGYVTVAGTGEPIDNAIVNYTGPISGSVQANKDGYYMFAGIEGTYRLIARADEYMESDPQEVTVPPDIYNLNFELQRGPEISVDPNSFSEILDPPEFVTKTLMITNNGGTDLNFDLSIKEMNSAKEALLWKGPQELEKWTRERTPDMGFNEDMENQSYEVTPQVLVSYPFLDGFERGNCDNWTAGSGSYDRFVTSDTAASGVYSFSQVGGSSKHYNGVSAHFSEGVSPEQITFSVRSGNSSSADGYFVLGPFGSCPIFFFMKNTGYIYTNDNESYPYSANTWYDIKFEIDWDAKHFDFYVNGELVSENIPFRDQVSSFSTLYLYNFHNSQAWWDTINIGRLHWLTMNPSSGTIPPGSSQAIELTFKATDMEAGSYSSGLDIFHNAFNGPNPLSIPCMLVVNSKKCLEVSPESYDFGDVIQGKSEIAIISLINAGNDTTTVNRIDLNGSEFSHDANIPFKILPFDSVNVNIGFSPIDLGPERCTMIIYSDAPDSPELELALQGNGIKGPVVEIDPGSLFFKLNSFDPPTEQISRLSNRGESELIWQITSIEETSNPFDVFTNQNYNLNSQIDYKIIYSKGNYINNFMPGRVIVGLKERAESFAENTLFSHIGINTIQELAISRKPGTGKCAYAGRKLLLLFIDNQTEQGVLDAINELRKDANVAYAEPDYLVQAIGTIPNDVYFNSLWGMHNEGHTEGTQDADIDAPEAWDTHRGDGNILVGVIDTGIDYTHPDLIDNMWINPGEIPDNGIDDDGNGFVDDIHGWDFRNDDNDPRDDHYHGTHCAGTIAATGNNNQGVVGVIWHARLVALKFLNSSGSGWTSDAIDAVAYANAMDIPITSNSWGGGGYSQGLKDVIDAAGGHGYLFVAAAGNNSRNNDISAHYPSSYDCDNIIAVAATDHNDYLAYFSNYGLVSVDLGAPGDKIYSCSPNGGYRELNGTSMATPHVSGAAALVRNYNPYLSGQEVKAIILKSVEVIPSLSGKVLSGGRLNVNQALEEAGVSWLSVSPMEPKALGPGEEQPITVTINPAGLIAGEWTGRITLTTNDPLNPNPTIEVTAYINGCKTLSVSPTSYDVGEVMVGKESSVALTLENKCNDATVISLIDIDNVEFSHDANIPLIVPALDSVSFQVHFTPVDIGQQRADMTIMSDAMDNPHLEVALSGTGVPSPYIEVDPNRYEKILDPGDRVTERMTITNYGEANLDFIISEVNFIDMGAPTLYPYDENHYKEQPKSIENIHMEDPIPYDKGGPDNFGYKWIDSDEPAGPVYEWIDIVDAENRLSYVSSCDDCYEEAHLSFSFPFYGRDYDSIFVSSNGYITFGNGRSTGSNYSIPYSGMPALVAGFWDDLKTSYGGDIYFRDFGDKAIIQFENVKRYGGGGTYTFQMVLHTNGSIYLYYKELQGTLTSSSIGIQAPNGGDGIGIVYNASYVKNLLAIRIAVTPPWLFVSPGSGTVLPGEDYVVELTFDSTGLYAGTYRANFDISHNGANSESPISVPCTLVVNSRKLLNVEPAAYDFGDVVIGTGKTVPIFLMNSGNDITTVNRIDINCIEYSHDANAPLKISPFGVVPLNVTFRPIDLGPKICTMTIYSDANDSPLLEVHFDGNGSPSSRIWYGPDSIETTVPVCESNSRILTIGNSGISELEYFIAPVGTTLNHSVSSHERYDESHFMELSKGMEDIRIGAPVTFGRGGPDNFGYIWVDSDEPAAVIYEWNDISSTGTRLYISDCDDCYKDTNLSFSFSFYGNKFRKIYIGSNGFITLGKGASKFINYPLPTDIAPANLIAGFWDDLDPAKGGDIYFQDYGDKAIIQFDNIERDCKPGNYTFQIVLYANGKIRYYYKDMTGSVTTATVGIQNETRDDGLTVAYNTEYLKDSLAIEFRPTSGWLWIEPPDTGTIKPDELIQIPVRFDATGLSAGIYEGGLEIYHNDPFTAHPLFIPCKLMVQGNHRLFISPLNHNFGEVYIDANDSVMITLSNCGDEVTTITSIDFDNPIFSSGEILPLSVPPFDSIDVPVIFTPSNEEIYEGTMTIESDAEDNPHVSVDLEGQGILPPEIMVDPNSLSEQLDPGDIVNRIITISNSGAGTLDVVVRPTVSHGMAAEGSYLYDKSHYKELAKGAVDTRRGEPVPYNRGGPDNFGYAWIDSREPDGPLYEWEDIATIENRLSTVSSCDDCYEEVSLNFPFNFYGIPYPNIFINSNGFITFGEGKSTINNYPIPCSGMPGMVAGFWDDLKPEAGGDIYFRDFGEKAIIQFENVSNYGDDGSYTFQMVLHANGSIYLYYKELQGTSISASTGIQAAHGSDGLSIVYNNSYLRDLLAIRIATAPPWLFVSPWSGTILPGQDLDVEVTFDATGLLANTYKAILNIEHNALNEPTPIPISCILTVDSMKRLAVIPERYDFGNVLVGESDEKIFTLSNRGNKEATVNSIEIDHLEFSHDANIPFVVPAFDSKEFIVTFAPAEPGDITADIIIGSDADNDPNLSVIVTGIGDDNMPPMLSAVIVQTGLTVDVTFSELMGTNVVEKINYTISGNGKGTLTDNPDRVSHQSDSTYKLTWETGEMKNGGDITITVINVCDRAGNPIGSPNSGTDPEGGIGLPPTASFTFSTTNPTNQNIVATLQPSEPVTVTNNGGSNIIIFTDNGEFTIEFEDAAGNKGKATATVTWIDKDVPTATFTFSITNPTNQDVEATLHASEPVRVLNNGGSDTIIFTDNGSFTIEFEDAAGNKGKATAIVTWIDKDVPTATLTYSITDPTNQDVEATLHASETVSVLNNGGSTTITFTENGEFTIEFEDAGGNKGKATATVTWIDKDVPTATFTYSITEPTNHDVEATLHASEPVTVLNNGGSDTIIFTDNGSITIEFEDAAGNKGKATARVTWIDKDEPTATFTYSITDPTNHDVEAILYASEPVRVLNNGGSDTIIFTENGEFTFEFEDAAGNKGEATATVTWIDKEKPQLICPPNIELYRNPNSCSAKNVDLGEPIVTDNYDANPDVSNDAPSAFPVGSTLVTWTAKDSSANEITCTQTITVKGKILEIGSSDSPYWSIQEAIDNACDEDIIIVNNGEYNENIYLANKNLIIKSKNGAMNTIIKGDQDAPVISFYSIEDPNIHFSGFTISNGNNSSYGGGIYCENSNPIISNNIIRDNWAEYGAGIYCNNSSPMVINNTIVNNSSLSGGAGIYATLNSSPNIMNTILWDNGDTEELYGIESNVISYCNIKNGEFIGQNNNISQDPLFVDPNRGNYHLKKESPCRDAGNPDYSYNDLDDTHNDMGADGGPTGEQDKEPPVINKIIITPSIQYLGEEVSFSADVSDEWGISIFSWDFDSSDNTLEDAQGKDASYIYYQEGNYIVTLTVGDNNSLESIKYGKIKIRPHPYPSGYDSIKNTTIGKEGGEVKMESPDNLKGLTISIPPNALSEDTTITISEIKEYPPWPGDCIGIGAPIEFGSSSNLQSPVTITMPYNYNIDALEAEGTSIDPNSLKIYLYDHSKSEWISIVSSIDPQNQCISAEVSYFGLFRIGCEESKNERELDDSKSEDDSDITDDPNIVYPGTKGESKGGCFIRTLFPDMSP